VDLRLRGVLFGMEKCAGIDCICVGVLWMAGISEGWDGIGERAQCIKICI